MKDGLRKYIKLIYFRKPFKGQNVQLIIFRQTIKIPVSKQALTFQFNVFQLISPPHPSEPNPEFQLLLENIERRKKVPFMDPVNDQETNLLSICSISEDDPVKILSLHKIELDKQRVCFHIQPFQGKKRLPLYYGILYLSLMSEPFINVLNTPLLILIQQYTNTFTFLIQTRKVQPETILEYYRFFIPLSQFILRYVKTRSIQPNRLNLLYQVLRKLKEPANKDFGLIILNSLSHDIIDQKLAVRCLQCRKHVPFKEGKKFCSKTCAKKYNDNLFYQRHKKHSQKSLPFN